ncbi:uncharacterized protein EV422DRAFT_549502 [Fimicolochytrium jonesii]|uniref:uncharacterized protein n=1 Tax=Fimicolochytrium jonesii TaxID=1396493 RepID=UPI0022FE7A89|nr:uncharacterized protein EV422DRAFT_549502 [Fimicolochytrium jonesii]KAI8826843.1 hypothetical protein EV422DRAFT_549502 [Fimicolochytrium jonesii]
MDAELRKLPLSQDLLNYYRDRLEKCEQDYTASASLIDTVRVHHDEVHQATWEAHKRAGEIADLQAALSEAEVALFEEKRRVLKLLAEVDELKVQELKDRKKIRYLLKIGSRPEAETTYFRDQLDKRLVKIARDMGGGIDEFDQAVLDRHTEEEDIHIMEDEVAALKLTVSSLRTQLSDQAKNYEATITGLRRDRQLQMDEERVRRQHETQKMADLLEKCQRLRALSRENIRELIHTKKSTHAYERRLMEERSTMVEQLHQCQKELAAEKEKVEVAEKLVEERLVRKQEHIVHELRTQLGKYEKEVNTNNAKLETIERAHRKRVSHLEARLSALTASYASLKRRRDFEIEGFTADISSLRKQLKHLERSILKYAPLEDRELVLLNIAKETGERVAKMSSDLHGLKAKVYAADRDLRMVPV